MSDGQGQYAGAINPLLSATQQPDTAKPSAALTIIGVAIKQVDEILAKADQTLQLLNQNLQQVQSQKIGLSAQKAMLAELQTKISTAEANEKQ